MKEKEKQSKALYILYIYLYLLQWMQENIYRDVFPTFLTKTSYGWWITRRRMEIYTKISEEKYPKVSVANIRKLQEKFQSTVQIRSRRVISQPCNILPSAWSDLLAMAVTSSFQLRIMYRLKHWIVDFLSFETTYSIHKLNFRKCSKSG